MATPRRPTQTSTNQNSFTNTSDASNLRLAGRSPRLPRRTQNAQTFSQTPLYDDSNDNAVQPHAARQYTGTFTHDGVPLYRPSPSEYNLIGRDPRDNHPGVLFADDAPWLAPETEMLPISAFGGDTRGRIPARRGAIVDPGDTSGSSSLQSSPSGSDDGASYRSGSGIPPSATNVNPTTPPKTSSPHTPIPFNRQHYPAFNAEARRVGMEHLHLRPGPPPGEGPSHYLERTQHYPTGSEEPQIITYDSGTVPNKRRGKKSAKRPEESQFPANPTETIEDVPDAGPELRLLLGLGENDPVNLDVLRQPRPGEKPEYPYPVLVQCAIYGSPNKRLTLGEIYSVLEEKFEWFRTGQKKSKWQGSIRHNLSLNKIFRQISRPISHPGKGNWWVVDYSNGVGNKRERKRNRPSKKGGADQSAESEEESDQGITRARDIPGQTKFKSYPPYGVHATGTRGVPVDWSPNSADSMVVISSPTTTVSSPGALSAHLFDSRPSSQSSRSNPAQFDEANIDPALRCSGHVVGEGRARARSSESSRRHKSSPYSTPINTRRSARLRHQEPQQASRSQSPVSSLADSPTATHGQVAATSSSRWSSQPTLGSPHTSGTISPDNALGLGFGGSQASYSGSEASQSPRSSAAQGPQGNAMEDVNDQSRRIYTANDNYRDIRHDSDDD